MWRRLLPLAALASSCIISHLFGAGFTVNPLEQFVRPGRPAFYEATNHLKNPIAVQVVAESWAINEEGEEVRLPTEDLIVYPDQFVLQPESTRRIKVTSRSKSALSQEKCYRVTLTELPISFKIPEGQTDQIYMANAYRTSYYIQPQRRLPRIQFVDSKQEGDKIIVRFKNSGNVHDYIKEPFLKLQLANGETREASDLPVMTDIIGQNLHAGITRRFEIDLSSLQLGAAITQATLTLKNDAGQDVQSFNLTL